MNLLVMLAVVHAIDYLLSKVML
jgi:hypothetical protein